MALAQVHPKDLAAPRPAVSVLLDGRVNCDESAEKATGPNVALAA